MQIRSSATSCRHSIVLLALTTLCACSGTPRRARTAVSIAPSRAAAATTQARTEIVAPWGPVERLDTHASDAIVRYALGGIRVEIQNDRALVAEQPFASVLVGAARESDGRWWFVTNHGTIARSQSFLGSLTFVRSIRRRVVRVGYHGEAFAAVLEDGSAQTVGALAVALPAQDVAAAASGAQGSDDSVIARVTTAVLARHPLMRVILPSSAVLADGTIALVGDANVTIVSMEADGQLGTVRRVERGITAGRTCRALPWGSHVALACASNAPGANANGTDVYRVAATEMQPVRLGAARPPIVSRDGESMSWPHACDPAESSSTRLRGCSFDAEIPSRTWDFPRTGSLLDVFGGHALIAGARDGSGGRALDDFEINTAAVTRVRWVDPVPDVVRAGYAADGRLVLLARSDGRGTAVTHTGIGALERTIVFSTLGVDAVDVAMADEQHGLAVGRRAADVVETVDGGLTWSRVPVAYDGDAATVSLIGAEAATADLPPNTIGPLGWLLQCGADVCRAGRLVHRFVSRRTLFPAME